MSPIGHTTATGKSHLVLAVSATMPDSTYSLGSDFRYGYLEAHVYWQDASGNLSEPDDYRSDRHFPEFGERFELSATVALTVSGAYAPDEYSPEARYAPYRVDARNVEFMAKTLAKITRGLDRAEREQGHAAGFAPYCARVAKILGCRAILVPDAYGAGDRWDAVTVPTLEYRCQWWIQDMERAIRPAA